MSDVTLEMCDPREHETQIKDLFARNGKPAFHDIFDRAYRPRAAHGLKSWVARADGRVVMHISVAPQRFTGPQGSLAAGILGDLMADDGYRDFWAPVKLLRKMVGDLKRAGEIDFLITTTVSEAESVFKAGGFKPFGELKRYVLPLYWPYLLYARLKSGLGRRKYEIGSFDEPAVTGASRGPSFRPETNAEFYATRIPRSDYADGTWLTIRDREKRPGYALVARKPDPPEAWLADALWNDAVGFGDVAHAAARWSRRQGFNKLATMTLMESRAAADLERYGFIARGNTTQFLLQQISPKSPPHIEEWFLLAFALTSW